MIGRINGKLITVKPPQILIEAGGVGYEIDLPISDCATLPPIGDEIVIYTHLIIREDAHLLYGSLNEKRRNCFRQLIKVSGIGPRIALALLSTLSLEELAQALDESDIAMLCRTPGIGKKMAERMLLELKGKFNIEPEFVLLNSKDNPARRHIKNDIANALNSLGFSDKEINSVIKELPNEIDNLSLGIKQALKFLNKHDR